jgi:hypothetical protein
MNEYSPTLSAIAFIVGALLTVAIVGSIVVGILAAGEVGPDPGLCRNSRRTGGAREFRSVEVNSDFAEDWQAKWDQFNASLDAGQPATVSFTESEATSRAAEWADDEDLSLGDITVCFYNGDAEARGHADIPLFRRIPIFGGIFDTDVRFRGRMELGGQEPRVRFTRVDAGDFPDWSAEPIRDDVASMINDHLGELDIDHNYIVTIREGEMEVEGTP